MTTTGQSEIELNQARAVEAQARADQARAHAAEALARLEAARNTVLDDQVRAIYQLIMPSNGGGGYVFDPTSVVEAVTSGDLSKLKSR